MTSAPQKGIMKKNRLVFVAGIAAAGLMAGCDSGKTPQVEFTQELTRADESRAQFRKAALVQRQAIVETKAEFVAASERKLADMDTEISELTKKSETYTDDAKAKADQSLQSLKSQRSQLKQDLEEFRTASADEWREGRSALNASLEDLEKAFQRTKATFE